MLITEEFVMQERYWLFQRASGVFYVQDRVTKRQESLKTKNKGLANGLAAARNQAAANPMINVAMAKAYLSAKSPDIVTRTWKEVFQEMEAGYQGPTLRRWQKVWNSPPFGLLNELPIMQTGSEHFLQVLRHPRAGNSTSKFLRIVHNRAQDLGWLLTPVLSRKAWPKTHEKHPDAVKWEDHCRIVEREQEPEFKLFYEMLWQTGGSQTDIANLHRDNVDMLRRKIVYHRRKLARKGHGGAALVIGKELEDLLAKLPQEGWLFPTIHLRDETYRGSRFYKLCRRLEIKGISLHSYRYAWAERAQVSGMPLREAMAHLGHQSRAVHQAYSEKAEVVTLPLEYYEAQQRQKIIQFQQEVATPKILGNAC